MSSSSSLMHPDWSIAGDVQETERRKLENALGHLSLERSSADYSLEFGRHAPSPFDSFHFEADDYGDSLSTAAHHASAITLNAGLGGHARRRSGSPALEYDPERRLQVLLDGKGHVSFLDNTKPDPIVVDSTAELNRVLRSGRVSPSSSDSSASPRPKLSDALSAHFSPKRPTVRIASPEPTSRSRSQFSKLARGLARDIEQAKRDTTITPRKPFDDVSNHNTKSRVQLPDVTGLTSAVASPTKPTAQYQAPKVVVKSTLDDLARRLKELEKENVTSRRRVRELEMELEECKADVIRERTRYQEHSKGKVTAHKSMVAEITHIDWEQRYKQVVEEKKALEALVTSLRAHLARMTSELESHKRLISDLRTTHKQDAAELDVKRSQVLDLQAEVDRLGVEIERLRDVVESGLAERRRAREEESLQSRIHSTFEAHPADEEPEDGQESRATDEEQRERDRIMEERRLYDEERARLGLSAIIEQSEPESGATGEAPPFKQIVPTRIHSILPRHNSSPEPGPSRASPTRRQQFIGGDELVQIREDLQERRSLRTMSTTQSDSAADFSPSRREARILPPNPPSSRSPSPPHSQPHAYSTAQLPRLSSRSKERVQRPSSSGDCRPSTVSKAVPASHSPPSPKTPAFPQIRGEALERLFFSAPPHHTRTCNVCHRQKALPHSLTHHPIRDMEMDLAWLPQHEKAAGKQKAASTTTDFKDEKEPLRTGQSSKRGPNNGDRLPPQTVLARVVRELEDDFAHFKSVYIELSDQYKIMDAASNVARRNVLAEHLHEVIRTLEQKGDQIASLYELLQFKDKRLSSEHRRG